MGEMEKALSFETFHLFPFSTFQLSLSLSGSAASFSSIVLLPFLELVFHHVKVNVCFTLTFTFAFSSTFLFSLPLPYSSLTWVNSTNLEIRTKTPMLHAPCSIPKRILHTRRQAKRKSRLCTMHKLQPYKAHTNNKLRFCFGFVCMMDIFFKLLPDADEKFSQLLFCLFNLYAIPQSLVFLLFPTLAFHLGMIHNSKSCKTSDIENKRNVKRKIEIFFDSNFYININIDFHKQPQ